MLDKNLSVCLSSGRLIGIIYTTMIFVFIYLREINTFAKFMFILCRQLRSSLIYNQLKNTTSLNRHRIKVDVKYRSG